LEPFEHAKFGLLVGRRPCSKETGTSDFCCVTQVSRRIFYYSTILALSTLGGYIGRFVIEKDMPFYCVAANCTNKACLKVGISLHNIPYFNDEHAEAKRRRKVWVDFVCAKGLFVPSKTSTICSDHCTTEE
jgi:hypothetical protein